MKTDAKTTLTPRLKINKHGYIQRERDDILQEGLTLEEKQAIVRADTRMRNYWNA